MYKDRVSINQKGNNKMNNFENNNNIENDPYGFDKMGYEQAFGIRKK